MSHMVVWSQNQKRALRRLWLEFHWMKLGHVTHKRVALGVIVGLGLRLGLIVGLGLGSANQGDLVALLHNDRRDRGSRSVVNQMNFANVEPTESIVAFLFVGTLLSTGKCPGAALVGRRNDTGFASASASAYVFDSITAGSFANRRGCYRDRWSNAWLYPRQHLVTTN